MATKARAAGVPVGANRDYALGLARAFGGAIIFGLPLLMTMEMWSLGFYSHPSRLLIFLAVNFLILVGLSRFGGFERTMSVREDVFDAVAAYGVGIVASAATLSLFGVLAPGMPLDELVGKVAVQSVPGSFGAMLARKQLTGGESEPDEEHALRSAGYGGQLFLMLAGALFLAFNVAPTEEMVLIGLLMSPWHSIALVVVSLLLLHVLVYGVGFSGQKEMAEGTGHRRNFISHSIVGYGIALIVSLYVLWTFGRTDDAGLSQIAGMAAVLGLSCRHRRRHRAARDLKDGAMAKRSERAGTPLLEWIASGIGLVLTLGMLAVIGGEALNHEADQLPVIDVTAGRVVATGSGFVVAIEAVNRSGGTAAAVEVEGALKAGEISIETSSAVFDYVPGHSRRSGGLFFARDPRRHRLELRALGYQAP